MTPEIRLEVETLVRDFKVSEADLRALVRGPVSADLYRRGLRVQNTARRYATGRPGPRVVTGRLRNSIAIRVGGDAVSPFVDVGTAVHYAPFVEFGHGNTPHVYPITTAGGKFTGKFGYVGRRPTRPYPFLRPALLAARTT